MAEHLCPQFFDCESVTLAKKLLGKVLCVQNEGQIIREIITETEAYCENDTACHAFKGRTKRNDPMFCKGGTVYVYLCYGIHEMMNISAGKDNEGQAVLVRGVNGATGPGKVTKLLKIDRSLNYEFLPESKLIWIESAPEIDDSQIEKLKRVGIGYASPKDQNNLWRFKCKLRSSNN
jgi:DNA-3-methyladenine glycosylase